MCMRCDGYSWEEIERHTDLMIRVNGYITIQVDGPRPWTYTIGAAESWDQPDLVVIGGEPAWQQVLVHAVADDYVVHGEVLDATLQALDVELVAVHESHLDGGLVAEWEHRYSRRAGPGDIVQVVPGRDWFCDRHAAGVVRLDEPVRGDRP